MYLYQLLKSLPCDQPVRLASAKTCKDIGEFKEIAVVPEDYFDLPYEVEEIVPYIGVNNGSTEAWLLIYIEEEL